MLNYNAKDAQSLFGIFAGGPGTQGSTTDGKTWKYTTGLLGAAGSVITGDTALILDGAGDGVSIVPEPGMLTLLGPRCWACWPMLGGSADSVCGTLPRLVIANKPCPQDAASGGSRPGKNGPQQ